MAKAIHIISMLFVVTILNFGPPDLAFAAIENTSVVVAGESASSLDQAVKKIRNKTKGKIMSQKQVTQNGATYFHIKVLLPNGKVKVYKVNKK